MRPVVDVKFSLGGKMGDPAVARRLVDALQDRTSGPGVWTRDVVEALKEAVSTGVFALEGDGVPEDGLNVVIALCHEVGLSYRIDVKVSDPEETPRAIVWLPDHEKAVTIALCVDGGAVSTEDILRASAEGHDALKDLLAQARQAYEAEFVLEIAPDVVATLDTIPDHEWGRPVLIGSIRTVPGT